ncbi:MAG: hypothetical protein ACLSA6_15560 [Holdemania massiliensis]
MIKILLRWFLVIFGSIPGRYHRQSLYKTDVRNFGSGGTNAGRVLKSRRYRNWPGRPESFLCCLAVRLVCSGVFTPVCAPVIASRYS